MKTIVKGKERLMAEIKANAESVINTEKADNEQWDIRLKNDRGYFQGSRSKSKRKKR